MKEVFELFDSDGKGYFTKDELFFVMEAMGGSPTLQELDAVMYELDSNGDHVVDFPEFLTKFMVSQTGGVSVQAAADRQTDMLTDRHVPVAGFDMDNRCLPHSCLQTATSEEDLMNVFEQLAIQEGEGDSNRFVTITAVARSFQVCAPACTAHVLHMQHTRRRFGWP